MRVKSTRKILPRWLTLLLWLLIPATIADAKKQEPATEDIIITTSRSQLLLFATVKNCFTPEMIEGVRNGIPLTFRFDVELDKVRNRWFDISLVELSIIHTLTYNALKEEYSVFFSEKEKTEITKSADRARLLMAELNGIEVVRLDRLIADAPYALLLKATLVENTFPWGIHYIVPFTSLWNFETDWRTIEFRY